MDQAIEEYVWSCGEKCGLMVTLVKASGNDGTPRSSRGWGGW